MRNSGFAARASPSQPKESQRLCEIDHVGRRTVRARLVLAKHDADQAGQKYAGFAAENLVKAVRSVSFLEWPGFMGKQAGGE